MLATSFTDAEHYTPITTGVLTRHQAQPGSEMATVLKVTPIADSSNHGRGGLGTHASNLSLAVVDDFTRESLALIPDTSLSGQRVARELTR